MLPVYRCPRGWLDFVFCIDCTEGMADYLENAKQQVRYFFENFAERVYEDGDVVKGVRCKVIGFRNYQTDGDATILESRFFDVNAGDEEKAALLDFLNLLRITGKGETRGNGLEALFYAMTSDWNLDGLRDRQFIVLFSNSDAVPLGSYEEHPDYPEDMVGDMKSLFKTWMGCCPPFMDRDRFKLTEYGRRMMLYAPHKTLYEVMAEDLPHSMFCPYGDDGDAYSFDAEIFLKCLLGFSHTG